MVELLPNIRIAVRALILRDEQVLLQRKVYEDGSERFTLPGGAAEPGERIEQSLVRECIEEIGAEVMVEQLLYIADIFRHKRDMQDTVQQQLEIIFRCSLPLGYTPRNGKQPDRHQVDVVWKTPDSARQHFFPPGLFRILDDTAGRKPVYLGLIK